MIRITRFFYIHILVIPMVLIAFYTGSSTTFFMTYAIVLVHECSHVLCALALKIRIKTIVLMPFGMTVRMPPNLVCEPKKEVLVALSGPFANVIMLILASMLSHANIIKANLFLFYIANLSILLLNLIPIPPLDGGRVFRAVMFHRLGIARGAKYIRVVSIAFLVLLVCFGVTATVLSRGNVSLLIICAFLIYSLMEERRNSEILVMRNFVYEKERLSKNGMIPARHILMQEDVPLKAFIKKLNYSCFYLVTIVDKNLSAIATVTESDIVRTVCKKGYGVKAKALFIKADK